MEKLNIRKLKEVTGKEKYRIEVSNRFAALEDLDPGVKTNSAPKTIRENIKISIKESLGYYEFKKYTKHFWWSSSFATEKSRNSTSTRPRLFHWKCFRIHRHSLSDNTWSQ
jgi:hypothetical protein